MKKIFIYAVIVANAILWFLLASFGCIERPDQWGIEAACGTLSALSIIAAFLFFDTKYEERS